MGTPTSTFVYTTVFAAGLAVDARAKRSRNEQWETAFEAIRDELLALQTPAIQNNTGNATEQNAVHVTKPTPSDVDWDDVFEATGMDLIDDTVFEKRQMESDTVAIPEFLWDLLRADARFNEPSLLDWPANTGTRPGSRHNLPPQSLWAVESARLKAMRNRQTRKKLAIQGLSVCELIHQLLHHSKARLAFESDELFLSPHIRSVAQLDGERLRHTRREIWANMETLQLTKNEDWPEDAMTIRTSQKFQAEPHYVQDRDGDFHHIAEQLNMAVKNLFEEYHNKRRNPEDVALATAKICHNLLISSAAPNLQTFNILLTGFQKWGQPRLVEAVTRAFEKCKIRPNEITCAAILDHYRETRRPEAFSQFVAKMRGASNGLMLARPDITVNEKGEGRLVRASETKIYQKVYPTPVVFNALMHGVLKFAGFERAMDIYFEMKEDGWGLDIYGLSRFLDDCLHRADWQGGLVVWEEIASIKGRINPELLAKAYAQFLSLCSIAQRPAAFNTVLNDVVQRGYNRKVVLTSVKEITNAVRPKKGYLAPAWTADNLLIAVSDYMKNDAATEAETAPFFEEMNAGSVTDNAHAQERSAADGPDPWPTWVEHELGEPTQATKSSFDEIADKDAAHLRKITNVAPMQSDGQRTMDKPDAWAAWMEHELGESSVPKPSKSSESVPPPGNAKPKPLQ